mgnify:CR=1 FL=1
MWKQTDTDRLNKESEDRTKQRQEDYEDSIVKMFEQKTELWVKEQQTMKDENGVLRNMNRSKCADNSELLVNSSTAGTPRDMLLDLGLKAAKDSILVHVRTLYPLNIIKAAEVVAESVQKITLQIAGNKSGTYDRKKPFRSAETFS